MGIFKKLLGTKDSFENKKLLPWNRITSMHDLDGLLKESINNTIVIFKHSTRCGTSSMALRQFEKDYAIENQNVKLYFLDLLAYREISNEIAIQFQVLHQSPQLIVLKNGITMHHSSHYQIDARLLEKFI